MALFRMANRGNPYMRLILLVAGLLVALGGMQYLRNYSRLQAGKGHALPAQQQYDFADPVAAAAGPFAALEAEAQLYPTVIDDIVRQERERGAGVVASLQDPLIKLCRWIKGQGPEWLTRSISRNVWHYANVIREPSRWRLQPLHVYGMLATEDVLEFPDNPPGLRKLYQVTLFDQFDQSFFTILSPQLPKEREVIVEGAPGRVARRGSNLAGDAVFIASFPFYTNAGVRQTPLLFAPRLWLADEPRSAPALLDERAGLPVAGEGVNLPRQTVPGLDIAYLRSKVYNPPKNGDGSRDYARNAGDLRSEKGALLHVFEYLHGLKPEQVTLMAKNPEINYVSLMEGDNAPPGMFGAMTAVEGVAISVETLRFTGATDGIDRIYLLTVGDLHYKNISDFTWVLATLALPEGVRQGDRVRAEGVFLKLYPYETRLNEWHWSPLLVSMKVERAAVSVSPFLPKWMTPEMYLPGLGVLSAILAWLIWRLWRGARLDTQQLEAIRQRAKMRRPGVKGGGMVLTGAATLNRPMASAEGTAQPVGNAGEQASENQSAAPSDCAAPAADANAPSPAPGAADHGGSDLLGRVLQHDAFKE